MRIVASMMILILMTSTLAGCVDSVENDILDESQKITSWEENIEFLSPSEGDWVEGEFEVTVTTIDALEAEYLELWVNGQLGGNESMDGSVIFSIDTSSHSEGIGAPVRLELEIRIETHGVGVMNLTAIFPQRLTDSLAEDIQPEWNTEGDTLLFKSSRDLEEGLYEIYKLTLDGSEPSRVNTEQSYHGYPGWSPDRKSTRLNSSHHLTSRMPSSA